jgi:hypothetical protein
MAAMFMLIAFAILSLLVYHSKALKVGKISSMRTSFRKLIAVSLLIPSVTWSYITPPAALAAQQVVVDPNDLKRLKLGLREITYLLDNWEDKTTYCNFGEFQRELLLPENKAKLMDAAKEFSLWDYDKSKTMNVMCKRDPQVVRAFLGLTPDNLLLNRAEGTNRLIYINN